MPSTTDGDEIALGPNGLQKRFRPVGIWNDRIAHPLAVRVVTKICPSDPIDTGRSTGPATGRDQLKAIRRAPSTEVTPLLRPS
ncbi:hypothetical protein [Nocardia bovistercoris]|uniref:hypothetical protein n=1 Tax=Nocardia bovistercoris TaxID=2785916 RepID=UPI001E62CB52|nr:hypothetical protein [Nocardia bovistercoris]